MSYIDITPAGLNVTKAGRLEKFLSTKKKDAEERSRLEYEKLSGEVIELRNRLFDYEQIKRRAVVS